ncbi:MAG TPA: 30S ribosomal protein S17 [Myxococcales bacterium]|jgi:small subunit ribosomal protein S17
MGENTTTEQVHAERGQPKTRIGVVTSNKMTKTVVVQVERKARHGKYGKYLVEKKKYKAHDEEQACKPGDKVRIVETRPMSKDKRWRVAEILVKAEIEPTAKGEGATP